jgi:predicted negative regulator of RcsB-dependent stress response
MAAEYLSDREQEEALLSWWRENWRWIVAGVVLGFAVLGGWQYWKHRVQVRAEAAAQTFNDLRAAIGSNDKAKMDSLLRTLADEYRDSPYADHGYLLSAQAKVSAGQFEQAATDLKAVVEDSKDALLAGVARLRMARVQLQLGHHDEALALLDHETLRDPAFAAQAQEIRGDILLAKNDAAGAKSAYQAALDATKDDFADNQLLRYKLQDIAEPTAVTQVAPPVSVPVPGEPAAKK